MSDGSSRLLLEVISGRAAGTTIAVEDELVIGRHVDGAGRLSEDEEISRQHARVSREVTGDYAIEDLGSSNGTFVNGLRIQSPRLLSAGDSIETGATTLVVKEIARPDMPPQDTPPQDTPPLDTPLADTADAAEVPPSAADTAAHSVISTPAPSAPAAHPGEASDHPSDAATPPQRAPRLKLELEVDFDAREAQVTIGDSGQTLRMVFENGDWRAVARGRDPEP